MDEVEQVAVIESATTAPVAQLVVVALDKRPQTVTFVSAYELTPDGLSFAFARRLRPGARLLAFIIDGHGACRQTEVCQVINSMTDIARGGGYAVTSKRITSTESASLQRTIERAVAARANEQVTQAK